MRAAKHSNVKAVIVNQQKEYMDLLFVVRADLWQGEDAAFDVLKTLAKDYPKVKYEFLVLPESLYSDTFVWAESAKLLYKH